MDIAQNNIQAFCKALREVFSDDSPSYRSQHQTSTVHQPTKNNTTQNSKKFALVKTEEGLNIMLNKGSIEDAAVSSLNYLLLKYQCFGFFKKNKMQKPHQPQTITCN